MRRALGAGTGASHRRGGVSVDGLGIPGGGRCVAPFVKSAQRENLGDLEDHEGVFMRNRHTIGENLPAGKQASAKKWYNFYVDFVFRNTIEGQGPG